MRPLPALVQQDNARLSYTLDPMGNRTAEKITNAAGTVYYTHRRNFDALGRLWRKRLANPPSLAR